MPGKGKNKMGKFNLSGVVSNGPGVGLGDQDMIQIVKFTLTAAQILAMFTTPVAVLIACPAGSVIVPCGPVSIQFKAGTVQFTGGGVISLVYTGGAISPHASSVPAATFLSATSSNNILPPISGVIQPPSATGISITNATGVFAAGNGSAIIKFRHTVQTVD
jgi:hypothetical protein